MKGEISRSARHGQRHFDAWGLAILLLFLLLPRASHAQAAQEQPLDPYHSSSASGRYVLSVDPCDRFGQGSAEYRLEHDGAPVWSARLPFALREAVVSGDGTAAGYSYSSGLQGGRGISGDKGIGSLRLVILAPQDGQPRLNVKIERRMSMVMHAPPVPGVTAVFLDETGGRFIAWLDGENVGETWHVYRLTDGHPLGKIAVAPLLPTPGKHSANFLTAVRAVPGTPLALFQWRTAGPEANSDACFALLDLDRQRLVWSTRFTADYSSAPTAVADRLGNRRDRAILTTGPATPEGSGFSLWSAARRQQITYRLTHSTGGSPPVWNVTEENRAALDLPPPGPVAEPPMPLLAVPMGPDPVLRPTSVFRFPAGAPDPPAIRSIAQFAFDRDGRIGFLREEASRAAFVLVDPLHDGAVWREINLDTLTLKDCQTRLAWLETSRWLLTASDSTGTAEQSRAWTLDAVTGTVSPLPDFTGLSVTAIAGAGDGRFVVLARSHEENSSSDSLLGFDREGRKLWTVPEEFYTLFSPQDVAVLSDGQTAAVVETIANRVQLFGLADGKLRQSINLKKTWGHEPEYPAEIAPDQDGGFIVSDWQHPRFPYVRTKANGRVRAVLTPRYADGRPVDGHGIPMRADPAGHAWMSDQDALLRLDARGRVDAVLGTAREAGHLGAIGKITVSDDGRLYAVNARTGDVHVFDDTGRLLHVCRPARGDVPDQADTFNVAVAPDHHVFLGAGRYGLSKSFDTEPLPQTEFAADGRRLGARQFHLGISCTGWQFTPDGKRLLSNAWTEVRLVDAAGAKTVCAVTRQFDNTWLRDVVPWTAVAPDGTFAVVSGLRDTSNWALNFYTPEGIARRMVRMSPEAEPGFTIYDGRQFVTRQKGTNRLLVFDADERGIGRGYAVELPAGGALDSSWEPFLLHGGRELWLVCNATKTVARFAWPP